MTKRDYDERLLRSAFSVAKRAREAGDHPFGSVLADKDGNILREQGNGYSSEGGDRTAHAERLLASWAAKNLTLEQLRDCTLYTSAEPCAMCSGETEACATTCTRNRASAWEQTRRGQSGKIAGYLPEPASHQGVGW